MSFASEQFQTPPEFRAFDPRGAFRNYERNLPHWRQPGASYFLTFRLWDSLPKAVVDDYRREQDQWQEQLACELASPHGLSASTEENYEAFLIRRYRQMETLMDEAHGSCVFKAPDVRAIITDTLLHFHKVRYLMHGLVVMPNHVHLAVHPLNHWHVEDLLHSWKGFSALMVNKRLERKGQLWQYDSWNRIVRDAQHWHRIMRYIVNNPARAKCWNDESTVWVDSRLIGQSNVVHESWIDEPW